MRPTADLRDPEARKRVETEMKRRFAGVATPATWAGRIGYALITIAVPIGPLLLVHDRPRGDLIAFAVVAFLVCALGWIPLILVERRGVHYWRRRQVPMRTFPPTSFALYDGPREPVESTSFRGTIELVEPLRSALGGHACAAYRLTGDGPTGPLDDAVAGRIHVQCEGQTLVIEPGATRLDIPTPDAHTLSEVGVRQRRLLEPFVAAFRTPFTLMEGVLRDGAHVIVDVPQSDLLPLEVPGGEYREPAKSTVVVRADRVQPVVVSLAPDD